VAFGSPLFGNAPLSRLRNLRAAPGSVFAGKVPPRFVKINQRQLANCALLANTANTANTQEPVRFLSPLAAVFVSMEQFCVVPPIGPKVRLVSPVDETYTLLLLASS